MRARDFPLFPRPFHPSLPFDADFLPSLARSALSLSLSLIRPPPSSSLSLSRRRSSNPSPLLLPPVPFSPTRCGLPSPPLALSSLHSRKTSTILCPFTRSLQTCQQWNSSTAPPSSPHPPQPISSRTTSRPPPPTSRKNNPPPSLLHRHLVYLPTSLLSLFSGSQSSRRPSWVSSSSSSLFSSFRPLQRVRLPRARGRSRRDATRRRRLS